MSRRVSLDAGGLLVIRFPFDRRLVDHVKTLPGRRWDAGRRQWTVPGEYVVEVAESLQPEGFLFDDEVAELYGYHGGRLVLEPPRRRAAGSLGLFDSLEEEPAEGAGAPSDYTVSALNERVREVLTEAFPAPIWLVGEIAGFNKSAHKKHVSFQLVDKDDAGSTLSEINATLFERTRREIERALRSAGDPFRLEDEIRVRMQVRVELYVPWGSYRVIAEHLDVNYTLGEAARRREEIVRRLTEAGLVDRNTALPFPQVPLRVGLITSLGSDAYNDVIRTLQEAGMAFDVTAHGARVQGGQTEASVLNALDWFRARTDAFDCLIVCRGGGSRTDLAWFDSEPLGRAVAEFPLPVVVGIGHEQDQSVLDAVGWRCKTPTAAAQLLVERVAAFLEALASQGRRALDVTRDRVRAERRRTLERARRLARAAVARTRGETSRQAHNGSRLVRGARHRLVRARGDLVRCALALPRAASVLQRGSRMQLHNLMRGLRGASLRQVGRGREVVDTRASNIAPAARRRLEIEAERGEARRRRLELSHPERVVERGYAILRLPDRRVLTDPADAPAGTAVDARVRGGELTLTSTGRHRAPDAN